MHLRNGPEIGLNGERPFKQLREVPRSDPVGKGEAPATGGFCWRAHSWRSDERILPTSAALNSYHWQYEDASYEVDSNSFGHVGI